MPSTSPLISDRVLLKLRNVVERTMTYTCDVERSTPAGNDEYGQPLPSTWEPYLVQQKCSVQAIKQGASRFGETQNVNTAYVKDHFFLGLPYGIGVLVTDRLSAIYNRDGSAFDSTANYYEIKDRTPDEINTVFTIQAIH